jgi:hypothetical protein
LSDKQKSIFIVDVSTSLAKQKKQGLVGGVTALAVASKIGSNLNDRTALCFCETMSDPATLCAIVLERPVPFFQK